MTVQIDDVIRVTAKMSLGVEDIQNVYHFKATGTGTATDANVTIALAAGLDGAYDEIDLLFSTAIAFDTIEFYNLTQDTYLGELAWPTLVAGDDLGDLLPPQTCMFALFNTDELGSQGRKFLGPTTHNYLGADGTPLGGVLTDLAAFAADLLVGYVTGTVTMVPGNYRKSTASFFQWVLAIIPDFFATQRRRYYGSGS
ncbi:MAG: hypothetical protein KAT00_09040 [Planctomycetes bacterium]|nr:hypothetical protein [Planctomycetota bacterium]